jgi:hypothetical protein
LTASIANIRGNYGLGVDHQDRTITQRASQIAMLATHPAPSQALGHVNSSPARLTGIFPA